MLIIYRSKFNTENAEDDGFMILSSRYGARCTQRLTKSELLGGYESMILGVLGKE